MILYRIPIGNIQFLPGHTITKYHLHADEKVYGMHKVPSALSHFLTLLPAPRFVSSSYIMSEVTPDR